MRFVIIAATLVSIVMWVSGCNKEQRSEQRNEQLVKGIASTCEDIKAWFDSVNNGPRPTISQPVQDMLRMNRNTITTDPTLFLTLLVDCLGEERVASIFDDREDPKQPPLELDVFEGELTSEVCQIMEKMAIFFAELADMHSSGAAKEEIKREEERKPAAAAFNIFMDRHLGTITNHPKSCIILVMKHLTQQGREALASVVIGMLLANTHNAN